MRQLNEEERKLVEKGIEFLDKQNKEQSEIKEYAERKIATLKQQWEFEDWSKPIERRKTILSADRTIQEADEELERIKQKKEVLNKQLTEGVEEKKAPAGVN